MRCWTAKAACLWIAILPSAFFFCATIRNLSRKVCRKSKKASGIDHADLQQELDAAKTAPKFQPVIIKPAATQADIAFVESHRADLAAARIDDGSAPPLSATIKCSPTPSATWAKFPSSRLDDSDGHYRPGDIVGKAGLEREYNDQLEGTDGMRRVIVNSVGKVIRTLDNVEAIPGKPIQLTIDLRPATNRRDRHGRKSKAP